MAWSACSAGPLPAFALRSSSICLRTISMALTISALAVMSSHPSMARWRSGFGPGSLSCRSAGRPGQGEQPAPAGAVKRLTSLALPHPGPVQRGGEPDLATERIHPGIAFEQRHVEIPFVHGAAEQVEGPR